MFIYFKYPFFVNKKLQLFNMGTQLEKHILYSFMAVDNFLY